MKRTMESITPVVVVSPQGAVHVRREDWNGIRAIVLRPATRSAGIACLNLLDLCFLELYPMLPNWWSFIVAVLAIVNLVFAVIGWMDASKRTVQVLFAMLKHEGKL